MITPEIVRAYIQMLCANIGTTADAIYNQGTGAWYFAMDGATIEVFLSEQKTVQHEHDVYVRCMAAIAGIPPDIPKQFALYKTALAINAAYMGFKISAEEARGVLCVIAEQPIAAMDYNEFVGLLDTIGFWANRLRKVLQDTVM